ncbi:hypothetical protein K1T71_009209 [Dendrolimus kikuchii]|uniref:Uncharacterized protein n=1 Tax=Dendrolimus kikuchii TaxID=765133 RepID=A0ACC1CTV2_9NEOP|nr:hypothetical protein K1T71_009209 [Dendrolimus kikuchii]
MDTKSYRWCVVPKCTNISKNTPEKLFIIVPSKAEIRRNWLKLAGRYDASLILNPSLIIFVNIILILPHKSVDLSMNRMIMAPLLFMFKKFRHLPTIELVKKGMELESVELLKNK